jgi:Kef-type K+ transport system membrane component KefB
MESILVAEDQVLQFTLLVAIALAVLLLFKRLPAPGLIGLLVIGMLIGPGGAGLLPDEPVVELLGTIGLLYIMFLAGLEIDLDTVRGHKRESGTFGGLALTLSFLPAFGAGLLLGFDWAGALLVAAAFASHTLISYPIVESLGLIGRRPVVAAVGGTLFTDTAALIVLVVVLQLSGAEDGALGWAGPLLLLAALAAAALLLVPRLSRFVFDRSGASRAESALYVVAVLAVLASLADLIGTEDILGAFLAGLCLNRALEGRKALLEHVVFAGRMLFIPAFFVQTGMLIELEVFADLRIWMMALLLTGVVLAGKIAASWAAGRIYGYGRTDRLLMVGMTIPQAAATLAVITTAYEAGLVDIDVVDATVVVIFLTCLAGALVTRRAARRLAGRDPSQSPETERP